jgi:pimeloyl-ACP methyl ester carboxylesterase
MLDLFGKDYREAFPRIEVPTLVIAAGTSPEKDAQLAQPIANMTTKVVDGAGHAVFYDDPQAFDDALTAFIDEHARMRR